MNTQIRFLIILFVFVGLVQAQEVYRPIPGAIPLQYGGNPATDLVYKGEVLLPEEAHQLYVEMNANTRGQWTLADLQPEENDIWKNVLSKEVNLKDDELPIDDQLDKVSFVSYAITRTENYRFTVAKDHSFYLAYIGPKVHNFLLRRNLLRKLGYTVPAIKHLKSLRVDFKSVKERNEFIQDVAANVTRDTDRWITSAPEDQAYLYAQDMIIMEDQNTIPNLAIGYISEDILDGRRIFQSLLLPYALTDLSESINRVSWAEGRIFSENVLLPYEHGDLFTPSSDDAIWMVRRILALTDKDWNDVAENCHLPGPVVNLLTEKLKSRRNHLLTLFKQKVKQLKVDHHYTDQDGVVKNGKLEQEFFEGYGRRFKIPDPESPLSYSEMSTLIKSKLITQGMELAVAAFNSANFTGTDVQGKINAINSEMTIKAQEALEQGKPLKGLADAYSFPTVSGKLIISRDVVAGSYIGTDNMIQLVDTIGVSASVGMWGGIAGVFAKTGQYSAALGGSSFVPVSLGGSANISFTRSYAHVKPIIGGSLKKALKYPFKNLLIPMVKKQQGKTLSIEAQKDYDAINALVAKEREAEYDKIFKAITEKLEVGESMIITDSLSAGASGDAGVSLYGIVNVRGKVGGQSLVLSRLHILRKSETSIQIYKDLGQNNGYEVTLGLDQIVPIVKVSHKQNKGVARTKFYNVNLIPGSKDFKSKLLILAEVFKHNSLNALDKEQKPYVLKHSFTEQNAGAGVLVGRWNRINSVDKINITAPTGAEKNFIRRYKGHSIGLDFESFTQDLIALVTSKLADTQFSPNSFSGNNPGFTFHGKAINKIQIFEGELDADGKVQKPYTRLTRVWNGWRLKHDAAVKLLTKLKDRYRFNFIPEVVLAQTKKIFLYNFNVNLYMHKEGIAALIAKDDAAIKAVFEKHQNRDMTNYTGEDALKNSGIKRLLRWKKKYEKAMGKNDLKEASNHLLRMVSLIERKLTVDGYAAIFGGKQNFLLMAKLEGFRIGDEDGDKELTSNTFGMVGNEAIQGPTSEVQEFFRANEGEMMTEGEFYVNWMMGRLI